ncbi:hypothetical protein PCC7424_3836 [Gloeothece citriformis PCC 7424]|uniref:Uncharacterized protein n=1 Tax=Gloeothece citriformis (strain PCC 7424) TaxID=65393 RepID=B7KJD3_GLOC7|nr:hypothetical protein [Gloeothece citriformis]ACK72217.1 hypothetical protein PCC7424_3836 [Gloeothece citriformis PCC 7424]
MQLTLLIKKPILSLIGVVTIIGLGILPSAMAQNQDPLPEEVVNAIASKTIEKFNNSSCQDLAASMAAKKSGQGNSGQESLKDQLTARFFEMLRENPQLTEQFFSQISTPVLTKLFQCGLIPPQ